MNKYVKSPLNYTGGKYSILNEIIQHFPNNIDLFIDVFSGGYNVGVNVKAEKHFVNDTNSFVIEILQSFYELDTNVILEHIGKRIEEFSLSKTNDKSYYQFREFYNSNQNPLDLYTLICFAYNHQIRFNQDFKFNTPFGKERSSYSDSLKSKIIHFSKKIKEQTITFSTLSFENLKVEELTKNSFVYCDPPYLITSASYHDGKRGFDGWSVDYEKQLFRFLDALHDQGIKFALSNVTHHKGKINDLLIEWSKKYRVIPIKKNYKNSSYNTKRESSREVLVVNY